MYARPMPLVYLPDIESLFLWGSEHPPPELPGLGQSGEASSTTLLAPEGLRETAGLELPLFDTMAKLAVVPAAAIQSLPGSVATWVLASKLAMDLVARERVVPTIARRGERLEARWAAALVGSDDAAKVASLARSMPPAAHAVPAAGDRSARCGRPMRSCGPTSTPSSMRWCAPPAGDHRCTPSERRRRDGSRTPGPSAGARPLAEPQRSFETDGFAERSVADELARWSEPALGARDRLRACFRLELPADDGEPFVLRFLLQSPDDPSLLVSASDVWKTKGRSLEKLGRAFRDPQESLLEALGRASRLFPPLARSLEEARPESVDLDPATAWTFLGDGAALLADAGFGVIVPGELDGRWPTPPSTAHARGRQQKEGGRRRGQRRRARARRSCLPVDWEAVIGDEPLTARELAALAKQKAPLVQFRGAWVAIDPRELGDIQKRLAGGTSKLTAREAIQAVLAGETQQGGLSVAVTASGVVAELVEGPAQRWRQGARRTGFVAGDATPVSKTRVQLARHHGVARDRRDPRRRHGPRQDGAGDRDAHLRARAIRRRRVRTDARRLPDERHAAVGTRDRAIRSDAPCPSPPRQASGDRRRAPAGRASERCRDHVLRHRHAATSTCSRPSPGTG